MGLLDRDLIILNSVWYVEKNIWHLTVTQWERFIETKHCTARKAELRGPEDLRHHLERLDIPSPDDLEALLDDDPTSRVNHDVNL